MKYIALILALMIIVPPLANTVGYLFGDDSIILDGSIGEEEKEERESNEGEEKDKEFNLEDFDFSNIVSTEDISLNAYLEYLLQTQYYIEDFFPPPQV